MPSYPEIRVLAREVRRRLSQDERNPYKVRRRKTGTKNSKGELSTITQYDFRTMTHMITQPLGRTEINRLDEGLRTRKPRFVAVIPTYGVLFQNDNEKVLENDEIEIDNEWYEVMMINNWDQILHAHAFKVK